MAHAEIVRRDPGRNHKSRGHKSGPIVVSDGELVRELGGAGGLASPTWRPASEYN